MTENLAIVYFKSLNLSVNPKYLARFDLTFVWQTPHHGQRCSQVKFCHVAFGAASQVDPG